MDYHRIIELKEMKENITNSNKNELTAKDVGSRTITNYIKPARIETKTINIKLPFWTTNENNYIPRSIIIKYYEAINSYYWGAIKYYLKRGVDTTNITIPLEIKKYYFSKNDILERIDCQIARYTRAIKDSCSGLEYDIKMLKRKLNHYESLLAD